MATAFKVQLKHLVQSMLDEGILDSQFIQLQALQDASNPNFVAEVITLFCNEAQRIINDLEIYIGQQDVDFSKMDANVHQLKGSSSSIGARRVTLACADLREASDERNKDRCRQVLIRINQEYATLKVKFQNLLQLENTISAIENNHHQFLDGRYSTMANMHQL
ncbi:histidine-containing phosphotransfer protein 1 [Ziziphus jujuba]|uniref:Histidine-containing phosphotransfer protein n=1 Tax=Ziziphus jujuba TaxID=326968 RepID=A0A6P4ASN7_ZIZJJ|nr:histidine-containing phosphotransfer protein 1 [Ziziphus jujuba]